MEKQPNGMEIRDPELPVIRAGHSGNAMENRRLGAPLPRDLTDAQKQQQI